VDCRNGLPVNQMTSRPLTNQLNPRNAQ
jgi:hypothetical protein